VSYLTISILLHTLLGIGLAAIVWAVGLGYLAMSEQRQLDRRAAADAYPIGLLVIVVSALLVLAEPWLVIVAAALVLPPAAAVARRHGQVAAVLRPAAATLVWTLPGVAGFSVVLGLLLHGPDEELESSAFGDMFFYVNKIASATDSLIPFRDLLAEGQSIIYVEGAPSFIGAVLLRLPGFDPVLFHTTTLTAFLLASVCIGLALLRENPRSASDVALGSLAALALVFVAMVPYPTWLTESPPLAMSLPLAFSIYRLWSDEHIAIPWFAALAAILAVDLLLTKVVAAIPFAIVVVFALFRRYRHHPRFRQLALRAAVILAGGAILIVVLLFLTAGWYARLFDLEFFPARAARGLWSQIETRNTQAVAPAFTIVGELLLLAIVIRARSWAIAAALATSVAASWFLAGQVFDGAVVTANLLAALVIWHRPDLIRSQRLLLGAAAVALALSVWFREIYGVRAGLILLLLFGLGLLPALAERLRRPTLVLTTGFLLALAAGWAGDLRLSAAAVTLTPADYVLWQRVEELVPPEGLVFTTMTGPRVTQREGWNNYPAIAGRQIYLAGWYDGRLTSQPDELERRLELNTKVLTGELAPDQLDLGRDFEAFFAVTRRSERVPPSFERLYSNRSFALYRIA